MVSRRILCAWTIQLTTYLLYQLFLQLLADIVDLRFAPTWVRTITYYYLQMGFGVEVGRKEAVASGDIWVLPYEHYLILDA